jgi:hypothetical protein
MLPSVAIIYPNTDDITETHKLLLQAHPLIEHTELTMA